MLKLDKPFRNQEILKISLFSIVQIWVLRVNIFFADPDSGSQNLADPTDPDPDPKHWYL